MTTSLPNEHGTRDRRLDLPRAADALTLLADTQRAVVAIGLAVAVLWLFSDVLLLLFAATLIACQLSGAASAVGRRLYLPYGAALAAILLVIAAAIAAFSVWRGPSLWNEMSSVGAQINQQVAQLWKHIGSGGGVLQHVVDRARSYLDDKSGRLAGNAANLVTSTIGNLGSLLLIAVAAIYLASAPLTYVRGIVRLMPRSWRVRGTDIMEQEGHTLRRWFVGQLIDMAVIGILISVGLWLLGVPLFLTLGLIAALCNFVPDIGALAGAVPALAIALGQSPHTALWVALLSLSCRRSRAISSRR